MSDSPHSVADVMTRSAIAVGQDTPFKEIVARMQKWRVSAVPVLEGDGRVIGVVSEADLLEKEARRPDPSTADARERAKAAGAVAADVMSHPAITVHPDASIPEAARIMARYRVKRLPVVDAVNHIEGVVSRSDLLKVFLRADKDLEADVRRTVLSTLPAGNDIEVSVDEGVVTLSGRLSDPSLAPLLARAAQGVEGVIDSRLAVA
ncbi:CBS domain-containing protein [Streptomyces zhihengii]|uniref:CBS domain-containing protein n=1 Tax=Streptomyces zhihengii TaxID=1818004 RepID=UPI0036C50B48